MQKRSHIIFAILLSFIFIYLTIYLGIARLDFTWASVAIITLLIVFYCLLPDIDHKSSTITWWFFGVGILGLVFAIIELLLGIEKISPLTIIILSTILLSATFIAVNFFEHRGFTHSIPAGIIAILPLYFVFHSLIYCFVAFVAFYSHLLGDGYVLKWK